MSADHKEIALKLLELDGQDVKVVYWARFAEESMSRVKCELYAGRLKIGSDYVEVGSDTVPMDRISDVNVESKEILFDLSGEY